MRAFEAFQGGGYPLPQLTTDPLWRQRDFLKLWSAQTVSTFGSLITRIALPFLAILTLHANAAQIAGLTIANMLPGFLLGLVAGVWVDRLRKRPVMIAADVGRALALACIPLLAATGHLSLIALYLVAIVASALTVFFDVAEQSYIPTVVGRPRLVEANSRLAATQSVAEVSAFGIAGWLVQWFTAPVAVAIDAVTFVLSAGFVSSIRTAEERGEAFAERRVGLGRDMLDGLRVLLLNPSLRALALSVVGFEGAYGIIGTVISLYALRDLGFGAGLLGLVYAVGGVSSLTASVLAGRVNRRLGVGRTIAAGLTVASIATLFLPLARGAGLAALSLLVAQQLVGDGGATIAEINQTSLRQSLAPTELIGRINGGTRVAAIGAILLGTILGGVLGTTVGYRWTIVAGALSMALAALVIAGSPVMRTRA